MPLVYLVDSAGVFLPLQEDVFPDTDDFGRIFYLNSVLSAEGVPQIAAIMGFCVAGGGYLPVLCDNLIMTEGSGLYLAGPALVRAAIGQVVSDEELGGAAMHAEISGTIDWKEPDDHAALRRVRSLIEAIPAAPERNTARASHPAKPGESVYDIIETSASNANQFDVRDIIASIADTRAEPNPTNTGHPDNSASLAPHFDEYKADFGRSIVCGYARIAGHPCGIVANQRILTERSMPGGKAGPSKSVNMPAVIYDDAADKAARFIMDCNQKKIPIIFLHDTNGFMVGRDSEQGGIIRAGAKMVNAMSNCVVPKISLIIGGSYGAGHYAMCGRAFEPFLTLAWPNAKYAVMGAKQATGVLAQIEERSRERKGEQIDAETHKAILKAVEDSYNEQQDIRHAAARGWVDRIIEPHRSREELIAAIEMANPPQPTLAPAPTGGGWDYSKEFKVGVLQV